MSVLCLIPARGGSKGLPGKNLRTVGGISLVGRAVLAARRFVRDAGLADARVLVDTDSPEIAREGRAWGALVPFLRPAELAADDTSTLESTLAVLDRLAAEGAEVRTVVLLQPTSPLRTAEDVAACWEVFDPAERPSVASVTPTPHPVELALRLGPGGGVEWREPRSDGGARRQECEPAHWLSGAVYVNTVESLREHRAFVVPGLTRGVELPPERSVDVDTAAELALAEALLRGAEPPRMEIAGRGLGAGEPCFIIAEAGVNHNGDAELAHRLVEVAAEAGADAVKFQTFDPDVLVSRDAPKAEYQVANTGEEESQLEMLRRLVLPAETFESLARYAAERGILFLSTPFDAGSADLLERLGVQAFKVPSGEVTNHPLIAHLARKGKPLLLSTGMSTLAEVGEAVEVVRAHGSPPLALLHCVSEYPAPAAECNLRAMEAMRKAFGVPTGWSDHTEGLPVSIAAAAMGASVLEKHFTLDRTLPGPDHAASLEPGELVELVASVRAVEAARGDGVKRPMPSEAANARLVRRSLHAARELPSGHTLSSEDVVALRPGTGISPDALESVVGRRLRMPVGSGGMLLEDHLA